MKRKSLYLALILAFTTVLAVFAHGCGSTPASATKFTIVGSGS